MKTYVIGAQLCIDILSTVREQLIASDLYSKECQTRKADEEQRRLAKAAEEQAHAQSRQAAALEERNRIERSKEK